MLSPCQAPQPCQPVWRTVDAVSASKPPKLATWYERLDWLLDREGHGATKAAAELLGVDASLVSHYRAGRRLPDLAQVAAICVRYKASADWLLGLDPSKAPGLSDRQVVQLDERLREAHDVVKLAAVAARARRVAEETEGKGSTRQGGSGGRRG